jgi:hypothetical protein
MRAFVADGCAPLFSSCVAPNRAALQYRSIQYVHLLCRGLAWPRQTVRPAAGRRGKSVRDKSGRQGAGAKPGHFLEVTRRVLVSLGPCLVQIVGALEEQADQCLISRRVYLLSTGCLPLMIVVLYGGDCHTRRLALEIQGPAVSQSSSSFVFGSVPV